jgi:tetratricopeptide (TPR) repeat protein
MMNRDQILQTGASLMSARALEALASCGPKIDRGISAPQKSRRWVMLSRHLGFRHVTLALFVAALLTGALGCGREEVSIAARPEVAPSRGEIPYTTISDTARALCIEGENLADVGWFVEARAKFMAAVAEDPAFVRAHYGQSNVAASLKEFQTCLDKAEVNIDTVSDGERLLVEINRTFLSNDVESGVELATDLVEAYPDSVRAALVLAGMHGAMNDNESARAVFAGTLEIDPDSAGALMGIATNYLFGEPRDFSLAEEYAGRMTAAHPDEAKGYELVGDVKRAQDDLDASLAAYEKATETDPGLVQVQVKMGHLNSFVGKYDEAFAAYDAAIAAASPETKATYAPYRSFTYIHSGDIETALDDLEAVADNVGAMGTPADQVKGLQVFALTSHATAALHHGLFERAAASIGRRNQLQMEIAEEVGTDDAHRLQKVNCRQWDGLLAAFTGDFDGAVEHAERIAVLVENDDNPRKLEPHHYVMGMAYLKQGDLPKAAMHLRQADYENDMFIRYHLAMAEEGAGDPDQSVAFFADVANFNFNSIGFALLREEARERAGG